MVDASRSGRLAAAAYRRPGRRADGCTVGAVRVVGGGVAAHDPEVAVAFRVVVVARDLGPLRRRPLGHGGREARLPAGRAGSGAHPLPPWMTQFKKLNCAPISGVRSVSTLLVFYWNRIHT